MYSKGNNSPVLIRRIIDSSINAKQAINELANYIKGNPHEKEPPPLYDVLRSKLKELCESIKEFKVIKTTTDINGKEIILEVSVFEMLNDLAKNNPEELIKAPKDEFDFYKSLGFSWEEYDEIIRTHMLIVSQDKEQDYQAGFNELSEEVLKWENRKEWKSVVNAGVGVLSIATDIVVFSTTVGALIPILCFSCATGTTEIALSIKSVGKKLSKIFRRKK